MIDKTEQDLKTQNGSGRKGAFVFWLGLVFAIGFEQLLKYLVFARDVSFPLTHFRNYDFAFSLQVPHPAMYAVYFIVLLLGGLYFFQKLGTFSKIAVLAWVLIFAGGFSNVFERIFLGFVRDYLYIGGGIFNLADMYILAGVAILLLQPIIKK